MSELLTAINVLCAEGEKILGNAGLPGFPITPGPEALSAVSVTIPARNEGAKVARTVRSLIHGRSNPFPLEVIVVDDASEDGSCDRLAEIRSESPNVSVVVRRLKQWSGIPYARNRGAEISHHPVFVVTDANTVYPQNWDVPIRQHFHPGRILAGSVVDEQTGHCGFGLSLELPCMGVKWITDPALYGGYVPVAPCTCTVIGGKLFNVLGGYDETLPLYGAAEPEFSVRAWLAGYEIVNIPDLIVQHHFRSSRLRNAFQEANRRVLLKNYVRFACSYLPEDTLQHSLRELSRTMGHRDFHSCMGELEREGIWNRRAQLVQVLRYDFLWLSQRFHLLESPAALSAGASTGGWVPAVNRNDLRRTIVVIPTFLRHDLTHTVVADCLREEVRVVVVDNSGDYQPLAHEKIISPSGNLGWLRANNLAIESELNNRDWDRVVLLNNDLRLSGNFFAGMIWAETQSGASIVGSSYDDWWASQRPEEIPAGQTMEAEYYVPRPRNIRIGACDGTAVSIRRDALEMIGLLDAGHFGTYGWSGMTDLCYRARAAGLGIVATRAAYVHHIGGGHVTAREVVGDDYTRLAGDEGRTGMMIKWGPDWGQLRTIATQAEVDSRFPRTVVYTAMFGDYDQLAPAQFSGVEHVCFTDQRGLKVQGWQVRQVDGLPTNLSADERSRLARRFKLLPHECLPEYRIWIWQDANLTLRKRPSDMFAAYLRDTDIATLSHPKRNCVYDEAQTCIDLAKDASDKILPQVQRYRSNGYPAGNGMIWSALIVRRNTPAVRALNEAWWAELATGSRRDQLSFNYVAWRFRQTYNSIPPEFVSLQPHKHQGGPRAPRAPSSGDLTILLLNWKRPGNLPEVIASIERQSRRPKIFIWNNGGPLKDVRADWIVNSSSNKACWPRWTIGAMAETEYVCSLDDDFAFGDERVLEDLMHYLRTLDRPDRLVGTHGVILDPLRSYDQCNQVKSTPLRDVPVDIVKGKLLACRRDTLRTLEMASEPNEDDIAISGLAARGRRFYHRVPRLFSNRMTSLPELGVGLSQQREHHQFREVARRKYFRH